MYFTLNFSYILKFILYRGETFYFSLFFYFVNIYKRESEQRIIYISFSVIVNILFCIFHVWLREREKIEREILFTLHGCCSKFIKVAHRIRIAWYCWAFVADDHSRRHFRAMFAAWLSAILGEIQ